MTTLLFACSEPPVKEIQHENTSFKLYYTNGGALSADFFCITIKRKFDLFEHTIFFSQGDPEITDIMIFNDTLTLYSLGVSNSIEEIDIDIKSIDEFKRHPIEYNRGFLKKTNNAYKEPEFIDKIRYTEPRHWVK